MIHRILLTICLLALSTLASASDRPDQYFGLSVGAYDLKYQLEVDGDELGIEEEFTNIGLQAGYRFSRFIAIEGRGGYSRTSSQEFGERSRVGMAGAFLRVDVPFDRISLYGLVGGSYVGFEDALNDSDSESDFSGGVGVELYGTPRTAVNLEYMSHADRTYEGISLGFIHHFDWPSLRR